MRFLASGTNFEGGDAVSIVQSRIYCCECCRIVPEDNVMYFFKTDYKRISGYVYHVGACSSCCGKKLNNPIKDVTKTTVELSV